MRSAAGRIAALVVADYRPPSWPEPDVPKQIHLDLDDADLDDAVAEAIRLGATPTAFQPPGPSAASREPVPPRAPSLLSSADRDDGDGVEVQRTTVSADGDGGGNPCPVVLGADGWSADRMQRTAAARGQETLALLLSGAVSRVDG